jgi:hypothetical protein
MCVSCAAGLFLESVTSDLIGLATKSSIFHGTVVIAIVGTLVFRVVFYSIWLWRSLKFG